MKYIVISLLVLFGTTFTMKAQDKLVLRNGSTVEVNIQKSLEDRVEYTYPGETTVYERPKSAIASIFYEDGRREILDESLRDSEASRNRPASSSGRSVSQTNSDAISWQDVRTTFTADNVSDLTRLQRISATSTVSYKDAILKLKKKAAEIGATTVLVMDDSDSTQGKEIEVIGIAYRDKSMPASRPVVTASTPTPAETSSNTRRRRILQQMESYNNDSQLDLSTPTTSRREQNNSTNRNEGVRSSVSNAPDAVELLSGRMIYGTIEEFEPDDFVSIRTDNGRTYEYSMDDVRHIQHGSADKNSARTSSRRNIGYEDNNDYDNRRSSRYDDDMYYTDGSVSGYKGTFDVGYTSPIGVGEKGRFEIHTSHGYQIKEYLFIGAGLGLHIFSGRDVNLQYAKLNGEDNFPHYVAESTTNIGIITPDPTVTYIHGKDSSFMVFPVFLDIRGYIPTQSKIAPFAMLRLGYAFNLTDGFGSMGLYMNPAIGAKISFSNKFGLTFGIGYSSQSYGGLPGETLDGGYGFRYLKEDGPNGLYEAKNAGGITLQLGVEF